MSVRILRGDCRDVLKTLPDESVHCVVTSPPYWGLRDYGVDGQLGLEASPAQYVENLVGVLGEVRRVLRDDGTLWLNLGDSYAASGRGGNPTRESSTLEGGNGSQEASMVKRTRDAAEIGGTARDAAVTNFGRRATRGSQLPAGLHEQQRQAGAIGRAWVPPPAGLKQKDLVGIPWMVAFALRADGWYLRQDIIWAKPNPMPESVRDRCTKAHEYLFLLSKSERYYFDSEAISEPVSLNSHGGSAPNEGSKQASLGQQRGGALGVTVAHRSVGKRSGNKERKPASARGVPVDTGGKSAGAVAGSIPWEGTTRNKRSVWTVTTQPFKEAHFATFPPALIEPCILAGAPRGGVVLDPFGGAGTTGLVADRNGRDAVLIELNPAYADMAQRRITGDSPLFSEVAA